MTVTATTEWAGWGPLSECPRCFVLVRPRRRLDHQTWHASVDSGVQPGTVPGMGPQPPPNHPTRRFELIRDVDESGISGTGLVAEGVEFRDGTVVVRWLPSARATPTTVIHTNIANVQALHGHGGSSRIVWIDARE